MTLSPEPIPAFSRPAAKRSARSTSCRNVAVSTELRSRGSRWAASGPAYLVDELDELFPDGGPFAVRSSVVGEDSLARSFAGQFDSLLFVPAAEVGDAIRRCWASAFNPRALAYQLRETGSLAMPRMAVVIQEMLDGDVSGVMFTHNAVARRDDEALVTAALGLCEGVCTGPPTPASTG